MIVKENSGSPKKQIEPGMHLAVCHQLIDLGTQLFNYNGDEKRQHKIMLGFKFPTQLIEVEGEQLPMVLSKEYNLSLNERAILRKHLEGWRSRKFTKEELEGFDLQNVLGKSCTINVMQNDKGYSQVDSILPPTGNVDLQIDPIYFSLVNCKPDFPLKDQLPELPDFITNKILDSDEAKFWGKIDKPEETEEVKEESSDDVPF